MGGHQIVNHPGAVTRPQSCLELEDGGSQVLAEERDGERLTLLHLRSVETEERSQSSRSVLNCYDMGGHMQYYCAQQIFRNNSSVYLLTFER